jgi:haloalkane dehalogenase
MTGTPLPSWLDRAAFPWRPILVDVGDGERLSVTDTGTGPTVLLAHGTPTWSYEWRHHLARLERTRRCIAPDHLGFGLSPRPRGADYRPEAHARRWAAMIDRLGIARYALVAHDFGGPIALAAALEHPERVERIVLYNTFAWPFASGGPRERRMAGMAGSAFFRWMYRRLNLSFVISRSAWGDRRTMTAATWRPYLAVFPDADSRGEVLWALARSMNGSAAFFAGLWARRDRLREVPIHLVWGMRDSAFPPSALARFREAWPHASVDEVADAGHWPHEEQPKRCVDSVAAFLGASSPAASRAASEGAGPSAPR